MKILTRILMIALAVLLVAAGCTKQNIRPDFKEIIEMTFDDASLKKIFLETDAIMNDPDAFWQTDEAYQLQAGILRNNKLTVDMDGWKERMGVILELSEAERRDHVGFKTAQKIMDFREKFRTVGIDHIGSFLPATTKPFSRKVYLTAECPFRCFMTNGTVVMNVTAPYFKNDAEGMANIILHEVFHIGYGFARSFRQELELPDPLHYFFIDCLHNEGMATWVSYTAQDMFANIHDLDYQMIDTPGEFEKALAKVNGLFTSAIKGGHPNLRGEAWELGVTQRAYYITGAIMAKTIDEKLGREALIKTIDIGPRYFVSTYNSLVPADKQVVEFPMPEELTLFQQLKQSLMQRDEKSFHRVRDQMLDPQYIPDDGMCGQLNSLGYAMIGRERYGEAVDVLLLYKLLFPNDANAWDSLGEAYAHHGNKTQAVINFKKSLVLNPGNANAKQWIEKLEAGD